MKPTLASLLFFGLLGLSSLEAGVIYEPYTISTLAGYGGGAGSTDGPPEVTKYNGPGGVAIDRAGNIFVADVRNQTIRKITPEGMSSTFAGKAGEAGYVDGQGSDARFFYPKGLAIAPDGTIYVGDTSNFVVRKITPDGFVTTLAGKPGSLGFVDGQGDAALFDYPVDLKVDSAGNIFVVDIDNNAIRKVTPDGLVTTFAGGSLGFKDGTGTDASFFFFPTAIAIDRSDNLFIADSTNEAVRKITPAAVVTTFARGLEAYLGIVVDRQGNVFVSSDRAVQKILPDGTVLPFVGGRAGSQDGYGANAEFYYAGSSALDSAGNIYLSDYDNETIRKITRAGLVSTFSGIADIGSRDGVGEAARFYSPQGVVADQAGNVFVADSGNDTIRKIAADGTVTTFAGVAQMPGYVDGRIGKARFNLPSDLALDGAGNLYVADTGNNAIRKITPQGQVSTIAPGYDFGDPEGLTVDSSGNIFVAANYQETIDKITPDGAVVVVAGVPGKHGHEDGTGSEARFYSPWGVAVDAQGNLFVADKDNARIRKITPEGVVTTFAGDGKQGSKDGTGSLAHFRKPEGIRIDNSGNLFICDFYSATLRKVTPEAYVTTLAGTPLVGGWVDGTGAAARFNFPTGIAIGPDGTLYVADTGTHTIRKGIPAQ